MIVQSEKSTRNNYPALAYADYTSHHARNLSKDSAERVVIRMEYLCIHAMILFSHRELVDCLHWFETLLLPDSLFHAHTIADHLTVLETLSTRIQIKKIYFWIWSIFMWKLQGTLKEQIRTIPCTSELLTSIQTQPKYLIYLPVFP